ncbi:hypothetical protein MAR_014731, partial [Mya arenaria]
MFLHMLPHIYLLHKMWLVVAVQMCKYRSRPSTCYKQCSRSVCCTGYQGPSCSQPICFGSTSCPNGGTCRAPNACICRTGYSGTNCS